MLPEDKEPGQHEKSPGLDSQRKTRRRHSSRSRKVGDLEPTSPEAVFANLTAIEDNLRVQYCKIMRGRRKSLVFFWSTVLAALYLSSLNLHRPSIYLWIRWMELLLMFATYICLGLFFLTGMYHRAFIAAPRFIADTNRGLRQFNIRLVKCRPSLKERLLRVIWDPCYSSHPSGIVKIVLFSRAFSSQYIENWEIFRVEFLEKGNKWRQKKQTGYKRHRTKSSI